MEKENFLEKLASRFGQSASVKNVYGEPVQVGDKTIIPVARIAYGLGGGYGQGNKKNKRPLPDENLKNPDDVNGEGAGGGGGIYAKAQGIYEITPSATRFVPVAGTKKLLIGLAIGFLVRGLFYSKRRNKKGA